MHSYSLDKCKGEICDSEKKRSYIIGGGGLVDLNAGGYAED